MNTNSDGGLNRQLRQFSEDVISGLSQALKSLPCKWFYDATGSGLFEQITQTPEYYLTRAETSLLLGLAPELAKHVPAISLMIEPGSGSSIKTRILLQALPQLVEYMPMDISADALFASASILENTFPQIKIRPLVCDFTVPEKLEIGRHDECLIFFPGSTIGNFDPHQVRHLLTAMRNMVAKPCWLLLGVDMTQDEAQLLAAYNDKANITEKFNKNLLHRINQELGADFNLQHFHHRAIFNRAEHRIEMHLVSTRAQRVTLAGHTFDFAANEYIHTENSYKYPKPEFTALLSSAGWQIEQNWENADQSSFSVLLLKPAGQLT